MKKGLLIMALLVCIINVHAQNWTWRTKAGGTSADYGYSIKKGAGIFIYTCGAVTSASGTFGAHSFSGVVGSRGWIAIQDQSNGTYTPPIFPTGSGESAFTSMDVDAQGNAYVTGYFNGTLTFGTSTIESFQSRSMFVAKMRNDGNWAWAYRLTTASVSNSFNTGDAILVSPDGTSFYVGGRSHQGSNSFLTNANSFTSLFNIDNQDGYIAKYDTLGNFQWAVRINALGTIQGPATCKSLAFDGQGNIVAGGEWIGAISNMQLEGPLGNTTVFPFITNANSKKSFLTKIAASNGSIIFGINAFSNATVSDFLGGAINGLAVDKNNNNIYLACTNGTTAGALIKYNATADTVLFYNNNSQIFFNNVTLDSVNLPVVCGYMTGILTVAGNTYTSAGGNDMFIGRLSKTSGSWDAFQRAGGAQDDYASGVLAVGNTVYMTGAANSLQINFDGLSPLINSTVNYEVVTARINLPAPCVGPEITQEPSAVSVCGGQSFNLSVIATGNNLTYQWQKGGVNLSGNGANTATYSITSASANDAGNYRCIVSNSCGADTSAMVSVTVNTVSANINGPSTICSGLSATLTASGGTDYVWSNGATTAAITVSPTSTTTYTVTVTGSGGCTATASQTVSVQSQPTAGISGPNAICFGDTLTLTASGGNTYAWSTLQTTSAITLVPGSTFTYSVTVSVGGNCSATASKTVTVKLPSSSSLDVEICNGDSYVFNNQTLTQSGTYTKTEVNSVGCDSVITLNLTVLAPITTTLNESICSGSSYTFDGQQLTQGGQYTATFTSTQGCDSTVTLNLSIIDTPQITQQPTASSSTVCAGESVTFNVSATGSNLSYQWKEGNTNVGVNANTYTANNLTVGTKTYTVVVSNTCGSETSNTVSVTVNALPQPTITQNGNQLSTQAFNSYQWQLNGNNINGATNQNYTATQNGNYTVVVTDANGCSNTSSAVNVTIVGIMNYDLGVTIYPNPTSNYINIETTIINAEINIVSLEGKVLFSKKANRDKNIFDLTSLARGMYIIEVKAENSISRAQVLKE